jgi:hypothetical protein
MCNNDFLGFFRIAAALNPRAMREALENVFLEHGMTSREFWERALENARQVH